MKIGPWCQVGHDRWERDVDRYVLAVTYLSRPMRGPCYRARLWQQLHHEDLGYIAVRSPKFAHTLEEAQVVAKGLLPALLQLAMAAVEMAEDRR